MLRIGVLGDTHGETNLARKVLEQLMPLDFILHTGDHYSDALRLARELRLGVVGVAGNCDLFSGGPWERVLDLYGRRIYLTHGHHYGVKSGYLNLYYRGKELGASIVVCGHTHRSFMEESGGILLLNPGSLTYPRDRLRTLALLMLSHEETTAQVMVVDDDGNLLPEAGIALDSSVSP